MASALIVVLVGLSLRGLAASGCTQQLQSERNTVSRLNVELASLRESAEQLQTERSAVARLSAELASLRQSAASGCTDRLQSEIDTVARLGLELASLREQVGKLEDALGSCRSSSKARIAIEQQPARDADLDASRRDAGRRVDQGREPSPWALVMEAVSQAPLRDVGRRANEAIIRLRLEGNDPLSLRRQARNASGLRRVPHHRQVRWADLPDHGLAALYKEQGLCLDRRAEHWRLMPVADKRRAAVERADVELFVRLCDAFSPQHIFGIGNGFGLSNLALCHASRKASTEALDAEDQGVDNGGGTELTRRIARERGTNVQLHLGRSPQDARSLLRTNNRTYDLVFVDGKHTDRHILMDFIVLRRLLGPSAVVIFHAVGYLNLWQGIRQVLRASPPGAVYQTFEPRWSRNRLGSGFLHWGFPASTFADFGPRLP